MRAEKLCQELALKQIQQLRMKEKLKKRQSRIAEKGEVPGKEKETVGVHEDYCDLRLFVNC